METLRRDTPEAEAFLSYIQQGSPFSRTNGVTIRVTGEGTAEGEVRIRPEHQNMFGGLHGGVYCTLADCTGGQAAMSACGRACSTLESSMYFLAPFKGSVLRAEGHVLNEGKRTVVSNVDLFSEDGTLCAQATIVFCPRGGAPWSIPKR